MNRLMGWRHVFWRTIGSGAPALLLSGCALLSEDGSPTAEQKIACGRQCLANGEHCSAFFANKNEQQRLLFEQAKQNFWICLKKYQGAAQPRDNPCIAPVPEPEAFDNCGEQLDGCLADCQTTLDEVAELSRRKPEAALPSPREDEAP